MERETGVEPATSSLGSWHSTTELLPLSQRPKYSMESRLRASPKSPSLRIPDSTASLWDIVPKTIYERIQVPSIEKETPQNCRPKPLSDGSRQTSPTTSRCCESGIRALGPLDRIATIVPWASDSGAQEWIPHPRTPLTQ